MTMISREHVRKKKKKKQYLIFSIYRDFSKGTFSMSSPRSHRKGIALREENTVNKQCYGMGTEGERTI